MSIDSGLKIANKGSPSSLPTVADAMSVMPASHRGSLHKENQCLLMVRNDVPYLTILSDYSQKLTSGHSERVRVQEYVMVFFSGDRHFYRRKAEFRTAYNANTHFANL